MLNDLSTELPLLKGIIKSKNGKSNPDLQLPKKKVTFAPEVFQHETKKHHKGYFSWISCCCCRRSKEDNRIDGFTLTPCTLRIQNKHLDNEYSRYQREEVYERGKILIPVFFFFMIGLLVKLTGESDDKYQETKLLISLNGCPTICFALSLFLASKNRICVEILGPILFGSYTMVVIVTSLIGLIDSSTKAMRSLILGQGLIYYLIYLGILNVRFLHHFIIRTLFNLICMMTISLERVKNNESTFWQATYLVLFGTVVSEMIFYVQYNAQAKLYLSLKVTDFQQKQLFNVLDTVPDKVLIVSRGSDQKLAKAEYANRKIQNFFGSDLSVPIQSQQAVSTGTSLRSKRAATHPMKNRIFEPLGPESGSEMQTSFADGLFTDDACRKQSLYQIVQTHQEREAWLEEKDKRLSTVACFSVKKSNSRGGQYENGAP